MRGRPSPFGTLLNPVLMSLCSFVKKPRAAAEWNWPEGCDVAGLGAGPKSACTVRPGRKAKELEQMLSNKTLL